MPDSSVAPEPTPSPAKVQFWETNEGRKDIAVLLGLGVEVLNYYTPMMHPGVATMVGLALRAGLNLVGNPEVTGGK